MRILSNILLRERFGMLSEPNVKPLASATLLNSAGNSVYVIVLSWLAYEITASPLAVGVVVVPRTRLNSDEGLTPFSLSVRSLPYADGGAQWPSTLCARLQWSVSW